MIKTVGDQEQMSGEDESAWYHANSRNLNLLKGECYLNFTHYSFVLKY